MNDKDIEGYGYKIIAEIDAELNEYTNEIVQNTIKAYKKQFVVVEVTENIYINAKKGDKTYGELVFFYLKLKDMGEYFTKLEYYDFVNKEFDKTV